MLTPTDPATLQHFLRTRRSVRRFRAEPVPDETLRRLLETAVRAPSAHNDQPWRFAVVHEADTRSRLAQAMADEFRRDLQAEGLSEEEIAKRLERSRRRIHEAPVIVILCMQHAGEPGTNKRRARAERVMAIQSVALSGLQLLLAAHAEGLGGVWTCGPLFAPQAVCSSLELPQGWEPQAMLILGFPDETPVPPDIKSSEEIAVWR